MKKLVLLMVLCLCLTGCWRYGKGEMRGYVTAVDDGIFWSYAYIKTDLESSDPDTFVFRKSNDKLREELMLNAYYKKPVKILFYNHIGTATNVNGGTAEIYSVSPLE